MAARHRRPQTRSGSDLERTARTHRPVRPLRATRRPNPTVVGDSTSPACLWRNSPILRRRPSVHCAKGFGSGVRSTAGSARSGYMSSMTARWCTSGGAQPEHLCPDPATTTDGRRPCWAALAHPCRCRRHRDGGWQEELCTGLLVRGTRRRDGETIHISGPGTRRHQLDIVNHKSCHRVEVRAKSSAAGAPSRGVDHRK